MAEVGWWPAQQDHGAARACPLLPELGRCPGVLQGSYGQKAIAIMPSPWGPFLLSQVQRWPSSPRCASRSPGRSLVLTHRPTLCVCTQSSYSSTHTHITWVHVSMLHPQFWSSHRVSSAALGVAGATVWETPGHWVGQGCLCIPAPSGHSTDGPTRTNWPSKCSCLVPLFPWIV